MQTATTSEMRELDRRTIAEFGVPGTELMDRAGRGVAVAVRRVCSVARIADRTILLVAGRGNNGGDAFVAARYLKEWGFKVSVIAAGHLSEMKGDAFHHLRRMTDAGIVPVEILDERQWQDTSFMPGEYALVVDGILGTGISGAPRGVPAAAIQAINRVGELCRVVAIDVPSGLDADAGFATGDAVRADITVTLGLPKRGFTVPGAAEYLGALEVVDIGIPSVLTDPLKSAVELIAAADARQTLGRRKNDSHKGTYGHVLVTAGSAAMAGAAIMSVRAAFRSGAGLVSALVPASIAQVVVSAVPEAMVRGGAESASGCLAAGSLECVSGDLGRFDAVLVGPGMTASAGTRDIVEELLRKARVPVILDADALNVLRAGDGVIESAASPVVITPHPGEMAKYLGITAGEVQADRLSCAVRAAELTGAVVVLKGAGTVVAERGNVPMVNLTGNPGMATGGMGDVLGGVMAAFLAAGSAPRVAAAAAVYVHGAAGDRAALAKSQVALTAGDVIEELPAITGELCGR